MTKGKNKMNKRKIRIKENINKIGKSEIWILETKHFKLIQYLSFYKTFFSNRLIKSLISKKKKNDSHTIQEF